MFHSAEKVRAETLRCFRKFLVAQRFLIREEGVCHDFFSKILSHSTEKIRRWTLLCFGKNPVSKKFMDSKGTSLLSVDIFLFHSAEKFRPETLWCCRKFLVAQLFFIRDEVVVSRFLPKSLSHSTKNFHKETLLCFRQLPVSENFMDKRRGGFITIVCQSLCRTLPKKFLGESSFVSEKFGHRKFLWKREEGVYHDFLQSLCLTVPKNFVWQPLSVSEEINFRKKLTDNKGISLFSVDKFLFHSAKKTRAETVRCFRKYLVLQMFFDKRRGGCITIFCQSRCLTVPKIFVGKPSFVSETFGYRKVLWIREEGGVSHFFVKIFDSQYRKMSLGNPSVFRKTRVSKIYMDKRRGDCITIFCRSLCLRVPKFFVGQTFCVSEKIGYRKKLRIIRGIHYYLLIFFCSTVPKKFVRKHFGVSESFWLRNFFLIWEEGVCHDFFAKILSHSTEKIRRWTLLCFRKNPVSKNFTDSNGTSLLSVDIFLFQSAKTFRAETLRCFRKFLVSQIFFWWEKMGFVTIFFPSLCLTVRKKFVGEPFSVPEKIRYRKNLRIMGGIHYYLLIFLCSTVPKNFVRKHFGVSETFWFRNFFWQEKRRLYHDFLSKSLSHSTEKIRRETLLCFRILRVSESFMDQRRGGCITFFCQNFWITIPQNVVGEPFCVS